MKTSPSCIVIDTNVLISAGILPNSKTAKVIQLAIANFVIAQNDATWLELETRIAKDKFDRYFGIEGRADYLLELGQFVQWFDAVANVQVSHDSDDDKFVSLAIDAGATIIISGDADLKDIKKHDDIEILSPAQFIERFGDTLTE